MKRISIGCIPFLVIVILISCGQQRIMAQDQTVTTTTTAAASGLDLQAVTEIVKQSKNAAEIEQKLNAPGSVNNLDLYGTGNVDYIHVTEYGKGNMRGFSLTVMDSTGTDQEIATIEIERGYDSANVIVVGEPAYMDLEYATRGLGCPRRLCFGRTCGIRIDSITVLIHMDIIHHTIIHITLSLTLPTTAMLQLLRGRLLSIEQFFPKITGLVRRTHDMRQRVQTREQGSGRELDRVGSVGYEKGTELEFGEGRVFN